MLHQSAAGFNDECESYPQKCGSVHESGDKQMTLPGVQCPKMPFLMQEMRIKCLKLHFGKMKVF